MGWIGLDCDWIWKTWSSFHAKDRYVGVSASRFSPFLHGAKDIVDLTSFHLIAFGTTRTHMVIVSAFLITKKRI